jgi:hypothetical protein
MPKHVTGGVVRRNAENDKYAVPVVSIDFPNVNQPDVPPAGARGVMIVKDVPHQPYTRNEVLFYQDSNHHNDTHFTVASVVGPAKYNLVVR